VFVDNLFLTVIVSALVPPDGFLPRAFQSLGKQFLWALVTGPFLLLGLSSTHQRWDGWVRSRARVRNGAGM
jgi:hypothetical protein